MTCQVLAGTNDLNNMSNKGLKMSKNILADELEAVSRVIGLPICYHDRLGLADLPNSLNIHTHPACWKIKRVSDDPCREFDAGLIHERLANLPEGDIHTCPFGYIEIAVPVMLRDAYAGVLFAGPASLEEDSPAIVAPDQQWLEDRLVILQSLAKKMAAALEEREEERDDRKAIILNLIFQNLEHPLNLADAADALHLSPSRTGHLIKELFDETFPQLINRIKMREAARMLSAGTRPIAEIADALGYSDQNYFSRAFKGLYAMSPREYRKSVSLEA